MPDIILNMTIPHLLIPVICTGALLVSLSFFFYIYIRFDEKLYLVIVLSGLCSLVFVGSDLIITVFGELLNYAKLGMQFHRIEQLGGAFFLYVIPLILCHLLRLNKRWQNVNKLLSKAGLVLAVIILFSAFIYPDSFISQSHFQETGHDISWYVARGREGPLYVLRDVLIGLLLLYSFLCVVIDLWWHKDYRRILFLLFGFLFGLLGAVDDSVYVHTGSYIGLFSDVFYSRFSAGITIFTLLAMASVLTQFIDQVKNVEKAYIEKNNAFRTINKSYERFTQLSESINEVFLIYDYKNEVFLYISPVFENIWGKSYLSLYESPHSWLDMVYSEDKDSVRSLLIDRMIEDQFDIEYRIVLPDNSVKWIRDKGFPIRDHNGEIYRITRTQEDITKRKKNEEELVYLAYHDVLTGLLNRRSFFERLGETVIQAKREKNGTKALLFIDLNEFKNINNTFGYDFGDKILNNVADRLSRCLRKTDYVFRISGDEFAVILSNISMDIDVSIVGQKIINEISLPYNNDNREVFISCSMGISVYPKDGEEASELVKNAYLALHEAKSNRNSYRFFNFDMNTRAIARLTIENNLRHAVARSELSVVYQPFVNREGRITGMEALLRWKNPDLGAVPPDRFIPVAETTGQIVTIGEWVLSTACTQIKAWQEKGYKNLRVAVNISAVQLTDKKFIERVASVLEETGLSPRCLELEITETCVMENLEDAISKINKLYEMGVFFSIDDFGVDYSALSYIKRFKINNIKIDRYFIKDVITDDVNAEITKMIIAMAHKINIKVIAEGVENLEQKKFLESFECDEMQGFLYSHPLPPDEFEVLLKKGGVILNV